jgi:hypothetical protein
MKIVLTVIITTIDLCAIGAVWWVARKLGGRPDFVWIVAFVALWGVNREIAERAVTEWGR